MLTKANQTALSLPPKAGIPLQKPSYNLPQASCQPFETLSAESDHPRLPLRFTFSAMLYKTSSIFMQVGSQSCPKRMTTTRSSSERMAWSTCQPLCKCGNMYDILKAGRRACGTTATTRQLTARPAFARPRQTPTTAPSPRRPRPAFSGRGLPGPSRHLAGLYGRTGPSFPHSTPSRPVRPRPAPSRPRRTPWASFYSAKRSDGTPAGAEAEVRTDVRTLGNALPPCKGGGVSRQWAGRSESAERAGRGEEGRPLGAYQV